MPRLLSKLVGSLLATSVFLIAGGSYSSTTHAQELGLCGPALPRVRDFAVPAPGALVSQFAVAGYSQWQVTTDSGADAVNRDVRDRVHALGLEAGLLYLPWKAGLTVSWRREFDAGGRFEGDFLTLTTAGQLRARASAARKRKRKMA